MKNLLKTKNTHKHEQVETFKIKIQEVRNECKRKASNNIHEPLRKIIRKELLSSIDNNTVIGSNDISLIRKSMDYERRKHLPTLPRSLEDALNFVSNCDILTCQNEKMTYVYKQDEIIIVTCKKNIEFLCNHCDEYLADGTFTYKPKYFYQQYTIHGWSRNYYFPLIHCFLPSKTESCYIKMWANIKNLCMELEQVLTIKIIHLDFEIAAHNAVQKTFTGVKVKGCRFHFGQALWRKIQSTNKLRLSYNNNQNETGHWLKMFFGLPFLPVHEVTEAFVDLISICPQKDACITFGDYIFDNYIEGQFSIEMWTHPINENLTTRTTNGAEIFHQGFNSEFYTPNPSVFMVIDVLRNINIDTVTRMNQYHNGVQNVVHPIEKHKQVSKYIIVIFSIFN